MLRGIDQSACQAAEVAPLSVASLQAVPKRAVGRISPVAQLEHPEHSVLVAQGLVELSQVQCQLPCRPALFHGEQTLEQRGAVAGIMFVVESREHGSQEIRVVAMLEGRPEDPEGFVRLVVGAES